ncbi:MAG: DUF1735 and LamG domain-containing protein [Bacteroidales bacterium]|nr:DUF1735 and LamG domain-containing protein [Bacteroidales bacterium]
MKKISRLMFVLSAGILAFAACSKDGETGNGANGKITVTVTGSPVKFKTDDLVAKAADIVNVTLSATADETLICDAKVDESYVDAYNSAYNADAVLLPSSAYELSGASFLVAAGKTVSNDLTVTLSGSTVGLEAGRVYVLPIAVSVEANLADKFTVVNNPHYVVLECDWLDLSTPGIKMKDMMGAKGIISGNEVVDMGDNTHTFEVRIYPYGWHADDGEISYIGTWTGKDKNENNAAFSGMELRYLGSAMRSGFGNRQCDLTLTTKPLEEDEIAPNMWHTITITCDGSMTGQNEEVAYQYYLDGELMASAKPTKRFGTESSQGFQVGYTLTGMQFGYDNVKFSFDGLLGEIRMWNKVLTQDEIKANLKTVANPSKSDMYVYWKVNEGSGSTLRDYSGNGRDLIISNTVTVEWGSEKEE